MNIRQTLVAFVLGVALPAGASETVTTAPQQGAGNDERAGGQAAAAAAASPWSARIGLGGRYDSNVAILDIDTRAGAGDWYAQIEFGGAYTWNPDDSDSRVRVGYDLTQSLYNDFDDFNLRTHRGALDASHDLGVFTGGFLGNFVHASLDDSKFLVFRQYSPYVSRLFGSRLFLRGAYAYTEKDFAGNPLRDSDAHQFSGDAFVFLDGLNTYLVFGYRHDRESAVADWFDYVGNRYSAQLVRRIQVGERRVVTRARVRHERRSYDAPDPSIEAPRRDRRTRFEGIVEVPLGERTGLTASWEYADNDSNLPAVDFSKHVVSLMFNARF